MVVDNILLENRKECPVCGKIYDSSDNFCSQHEDKVELVYSKDLVKICPKCNRKFKSIDNFCSQHDDLIKLVYIEDLTKMCTNCNSKYPDDYTKCIRCDSDEELVKIIQTPKIKEINTNPNKFYKFRDYSNHFSEITELLSPKNISKLNNLVIDEEQLNFIIENIKKTYQKILNCLIDKYSIDFDSLTPRDKILLFSKTFVKTDFKAGGGTLGHFQFNEVYIDDRSYDAQQITSIIHELSHFLLSEILEQIVSCALDTDKTEAVEAFVCYTLIRDNFNYLVDEYCAHTVEGRFAALGYQDYGSYKSRLQLFLEDYSEEYIEIAKAVGNTFADYIKYILSSFIDDDLREDIKNEFLNTNELPQFSELQYETDRRMDLENFSSAIRLMLTSNVEDFTKNPEDIEKLKIFCVKFKKFN